MTRRQITISKPTLFDWDEGNLNKNRLKHNVQPAECEAIFLNKPLLIGEDIIHSQTEKRYQAMGTTHEGRLLFVAFTFRNGSVRIISARDQHRKERAVYK